MDYIQKMSHSLKTFERNRKIAICSDLSWNTMYVNKCTEKYMKVGKCPKISKYQTIASKKTKNFQIKRKMYEQNTILSTDAI